MSRRQTPHAKREKSRERRALDRAIIRCVRQLTFNTSQGADGKLWLHPNDLAELVGLSIARRRL
jgi:hypothetical protein